MNKRFVLVLMVLVLALSACMAPYRVKKATATDWVWGTEILDTDAARIWLRYDNIAGYCTADPALAAKAIEAEGALVQITFESVRWGDEENGASSGCGRLSTGSESSTPIFKLTDLRVISREVN